MEVKHLLRQVMFTRFSRRCRFAPECRNYYEASYTCGHPSSYCGGYRRRANPNSDLLSKRFRLADRVFVVALVLCSVSVYLLSGNIWLVGAVGLVSVAVFLFVAAPLIVKYLGNRYGGH